MEARCRCRGIELWRRSVEGRLCLLDVPDVPEAMRCMLLCGNDVAEALGSELEIQQPEHVNAMPGISLFRRRYGSPLTLAGPSGSTR